ncbi:hypothetical protein PV326_008425 [Microctonus aethiopoides]|nr:hypothetical protein PV326_008425 [Microctonus aethiopoides]
MKGKRVNFIKLLILIPSIVIINVESCPKNCLCYLDNIPRSVVCSNQGLDEFPEKLSDLVEYLDLSNNNLHYLPDDIGRLIELKYINLSRNQLTGLPAVIGDLWKLEKIDLSDNLISDVAEEISAIERLPNLRLLYLGKNPMNSLDDLMNIALKALDVSECAITQLNNDSLIGFPELISLNLDGNPLTSIQHIKSAKLKWLDLSNCMLNLLHPNTFDNIPELEQLRMANNPLLVFSTRMETLRHNKLKRLDVTGCNLDRPGVHGLPSLTHAKFSKNVIRFLPDRIFSKNKMLTHLYLNENALSRLNASSFAGLPKLEVLDLSGNIIENLPETLLNDNIYLRIFNLSYNDIKSIPKTFPNSAIVFDLSSNLITNIPTDILINMPRIKNFNLSKNRLEFFNSGLSSTSLKTLNLEGNRLVKLTNESFVNLSALTELDLSGNRLTEGINYEVFQHNTNLEKIFLHDNPWRCDCEQLYPTFHYLMQGSKTKSSSLICQSPNNVSGYSWTAACYKLWNLNNEETSSNKNIHGLIIMGVLISFLIFGSCVSIGHTIKTKKRQAALRLREAERAEARERLIHHRRSRQIEESRHEEDNIPRVHPEELIGPPTYEEAVEMPRVVRSLENLDSIISIDNLGQSAQSLDHDAWARKRRMQTRKRIMSKRAKSEDNLDSRRDERTENSKRNNKNSDRKIRTVNKNSDRLKRNFQEHLEPTCSVDDGFRKAAARPKTPNNYRRKKRISIKYDGHSSDDEDSDTLGNSTVGARYDVIIDDASVIDLPREPRSGTYRPSIVTPPPSSPELISSPEPYEGTAEQFPISRSEIV